MSPTSRDFSIVRGPKILTPNRNSRKLQCDFCARSFLLRPLPSGIFGAKLFFQDFTPLVLGPLLVGKSCLLQGSTWRRINFNRHHQKTSYHARGNKYISNSRRFFDIYIYICIRIEFEFINQENFPRMCIHVCYKRTPAKSTRYVYLIQNQWHSDFFTYVHVY